MLILDTDHLSIFGEPTPLGLNLLERLKAADQNVVTTIVTVEENLQGWLGAIHRAKTEQALIWG